MGVDRFLLGRLIVVAEIYNTYDVISHGCHAS
jgi:hypothetical protein